jgi:Icc-related predicted phosphoesterase
MMIPKTEVPFLVISDTHDFDFFSKNPNQPLRNEHGPEADVILHCGDFTENGSPEQLQRAFMALGAMKAELKLVVAGNHEASLDRDFFLSQGGEASEHEKCRTIAEFSAAKYGVQFLEEGTHSFTLKSGASFTIYTSPYTPKFGDSAFQYESSHDRYNPKEKVLPEAKSVATDTSLLRPGTDIVMTHGPPKYVLDRTNMGDSAGSEPLRRAIRRVQPKLHCFGHVHPSYGLQRVRWEDSRLSGFEEQSSISYEINSNGKRRSRDDIFIKFKRLRENDECSYDGMIQMKTFIGKAQAKKKGYAAMGVPDAEDFKSDKNQTLFVNAAIMDKEGEPTNPPWLVALELPIKA